MLKLLGINRNRRHFLLISTDKIRAGSRRPAYFIAGACLWGLAAVAAVGSGGRTVEHLSLADGRTALFMSNGPAKDALIYLHAAGEGADAAMRYSGFAATAARHDMAVAFGASADGFWRFTGFAGHDGDGDEAYVFALRDRLVARGYRKIFLAGMSNGGVLALQAACRRPDLFGGVGIIVSGMPETIGRTCANLPARFVAILGDADGTFPTAGGIGAAPLLGSLWSLDRLRRFAGVGTTGISLRTLASGNARNVTLYESAYAHIYLVHGGAHEVFNEDLWRRLLLPRNSLFLASEKMLEAFR